MTPLARLLCLGAALALVLAVLVPWLRGGGPGDAGAPGVGSGAEAGPSAALEAPSVAAGRGRGASRAREAAVEPSAGAAPPGEEWAGSAAAPVNVTGRVTWPDGRPVGGVVVWGIEPWPGDATPSAVTREDGAWTLVLPPGPQPVAAKDAASVATRTEVRVLDGVGEQTGPTIVLDAGGRISGTVTDPEGAPVEGARVRCRATDGSLLESVVDGAPFDRGLGDALTDATGRFVLGGLHDAPYSVHLDTAGTPGMRGQPESHDGVRVPAEVGFTLLTATRIAGAVKDARTGAPVQRSRVCGVDVDDARGHFDVAVFTGAGTDLSRGAPLTVSARGYLPWSDASVLLQEGDVLTGLVVLLEPDPRAARLVIAAVDELGDPVPGFSCRGYGFGGGGIVHEETGGAELEIEGLVPGRYTLAVRADGHALADLVVQIDAGADERREVVLPRGRRVHVRVLDSTGALARLAALRVLRDDGSAPPFEFVYGEPSLASLQQVSSVHSPGGEGAGWTDLSDAVGWLEGLPAGRYTLAARAGDCEGAPVGFVVSAEEEGSLELCAGEP